QQHQELGVLLLGWPCLHGVSQLMEDLLDEHGPCRHDQEADPGAADDEELRRLDQDAHLAAVEDIPAEDRAEHDDETHDYKHGTPLFDRFDPKFEAYFASIQRRLRRMGRSKGTRSF